MIGQGKIVGAILIFVGLAIVPLYLLWGALNMARSEGQFEITGLVFGSGLLFVVVALLVGSGLFLFVKGREEARRFAEVEKEKRILNMVQTQGQIKVAEVALEMRLTLDQVKAYIYDLVGKGLFSGYINWDDGILYARDAKEMQTTKCPHCGGEREVVGKGVVKCPYCGTELFL